MIRRICLLCEQAGESEAVRAAENEFATAVRDYRLEHGAEALSESELNALFATEKGRVVEALVLSELLAPLLTSPRGSTTGGGKRDGLLASGHTQPTAGPRPGHPAGGPPDITDLLDAMLADERARPRATLSRNQS